MSGALLGSYCLIRAEQGGWRMEGSGSRRLCSQDFVGVVSFCCLFVFMWDLGRGVRVTAGIMNILECLTHLGQGTAAQALVSMLTPRRKPKQYSETCSPALALPSGPWISDP